MRYTSNRSAVSRQGGCQKRRYATMILLKNLWLWIIEAAAAFQLKMKMMKSNMNNNMTNSHNAIKR